MQVDGYPVRVSKFGLMIYDGLKESPAIPTELVEMILDIPKVSYKKTKISFSGSELKDTGTKSTKLKSKGKTSQKKKKKKKKAKLGF